MPPYAHASRLATVARARTVELLFVAFALALGGPSPCRASVADGLRPTPVASATPACALPDEPANSFATDLSPAPNGSVATRRPAVFAHLHGAFDPRSVRVMLDAKDVTANSLRWPGGFAYVATLVAGCHNVDVTASASGGAQFERRWAFASGTQPAANRLTLYSGPQNGDAVVGGIYANGNASVSAQIIALSGLTLGTATAAATASPGNLGMLLDAATDAQTTGDASTAFQIDVPVHANASARGAFVLLAIDPSDGDATTYSASGLRAATLWCPGGSQHTLGASTVKEIAAFDAAQNDLCTGNFARARARFAADLNVMRANHRYDGRRWLDFALDYEYALLAVHADDDAARFLRSIDDNRVPNAADRLYFAGKYAAAITAYDAIQKRMSAGSGYDTSGSFAGLLAGNAFARERRWPDAFAAWIGAAGTGHTVPGWDAFDDWNLDALQMIYYYRAHAPQH
jgi:hypothetical protein